MILICHSEDQREHLCPFTSNCSLHSLSCDGSALCSSCTHGMPYLVFGLKCHLEYAIVCDPSRVFWQWEILESHWWSPCPDSQNCWGIHFQDSKVCISSHLFWIYIFTITCRAFNEILKTDWTTFSADDDYVIGSVWKSSPKTGKRPRLGRTKTGKDRTSSPGLWFLRIKDRKKTGLYEPVWTGESVPLI